MTKKAGSHHVVPNADGGWDVKKDGATRSSGHFDKKQEKGGKDGKREKRTSEKFQTSTSCNLHGPEFSS